MSLDLIDRALGSKTKPLCVVAIGAIEQECFLGPGGLLDTAEKAVAAGKIRYLGVSAHRPAIALKALDTEVLRVVMVPANFISREYIDGEFMHQARERQAAAGLPTPPCACDSSNNIRISFPALA